MNVFELFAKLGLNTTEYEEGLQEAEKKGSGFGKALGKAAKVAGAAVVGASTAVVGFGAESVKAGMSFDSSMSQVAATMGKTVDEITNLRDFAQEMGSTTAFSATQAADALNYMALAGYDAETSMSMLPNVLNLAAAGGIELAEASDMVTDASSALGLSIEETTVMVDQMAKASSASNTSVAQLGQAILTVGATASNMSGGTQELATILGVLADNGIKGAEGGTHLRNILLSLQDAADEEGLITFSNGIEDVSISLYDAEGNMRSIIDVITEMQSGMEGMSQQAQDAMVQGMFNRADLASVNALLSTSSDRFYELQASIGEAQGSAQAMADTQLDNLSGDITLFQSALEGAQIAISDELSPTLREFVQLGSKGLSDVTAAFQEGGLSGAFSALGTWISEALSMVFDHLDEIVDAGISLLEAFVGGVLDNADVILEAGAKIILRLASGLAEHADDIAPTIVSLVHTIVSIFSNPEVAVPLTRAGLQIISGFAIGLAEATPELVGMIPELIANIIMTLGEVGPDISDTILELIGSLAVSVLGSIGGLMGMSYDEIESGFLAVFDAADQFGQDVLDWFSSIFEGDLLGDVGSFFTDLFGDFSDGFSDALGVVTGFGQDVWDSITGTFDNVKNTVSNAIDKLIEMFDFDWSLPQIKLPHFNISGGEAPWGFAGQGSFPKVEIQWYKKAMNAPYLLDSATIFGAANGHYMGGGEAGAEMIYSHDKLMSDIGAVVDSKLSKLTFEVPVYIGGRKIDSQIISANARNNFISGGR